MPENSPIFNINRLLAVAQSQMAASVPLTGKDPEEALGLIRRLWRRAIANLKLKHLQQPPSSVNDLSPEGPEGQVPAPTKEQIMNYNTLKQKLFEAVSKADMPCNKPRASTRPGKKRMVKACEGGKEKIIHFGASNYGHNYSPKARKSFRARHKCGEKKSKLSAQYWACKNLWAGPKGSKKACPAGRQCKY